MHFIKLILTFPKFYTNSNNYFIESENDVHTKDLFYASNEINDFYSSLNDDFFGPPFDDNY